MNTFFPAYIQLLWEPSNIMEKYKVILLFCVPGHNNVVDNEILDEIARRGSCMDIVDEDTSARIGKNKVLVCPLKQTIVTLDQ